jgi:hypothetical protein
MDIDVPRSAGMKLIPTRERSPWLSDSLISPPVSQEWKIPPQEGAYTHAPSQDVDMYDEISLGLGLAPDFRAIGPASENAAEEPASHADEPNAGDRELKNMFDGLGLGNLSYHFHPAVYVANIASSESFLSQLPRIVSSITVLARSIPLPPMTKCTRNRRAETAKTPSARPTSRTPSPLPDARAAERLSAHQPRFSACAA